MTTAEAQCVAAHAPPSVAHRLHSCLEHISASAGTITTTCGCICIAMALATPAATTYPRLAANALAKTHARPTAAFDRAISAMALIGFNAYNAHTLNTPSISVVTVVASAHSSANATLSAASHADAVASSTPTPDVVPPDPAHRAMRSTANTTIGCP